MRKERLVALDGLRGVAAVAVALRHAKIAGFGMAHGDLAVDLFFLLSGFVIAKSYEGQLRDGRLSLGRYAMVRLERLYPMLFLGSVTGAALWAAGLGKAQIDGGGMLAGALVSQFFLVPFLASTSFCVFNSAHWSIFFEMMANLAHAAALPRLTDRALAAIVGVSVVGLALAARRYGELDLGWQSETFAWGVPRVGFGFFGGVLLWRTRERWRGWVPRLPLAVLALVVLAVADAPSRLGVPGVFDFLCVVLVFPPLVMAATVCRGGRVAEALGTISFPLYAIHKPIVEALWQFRPGWAASVLAFGAIVLASYLLGQFVDEPLNAWRRGRRRAARGLVAA